MEIVPSPTPTPHAAFELTWTFPIWEILVSVVVTGVVTAVTIVWSVRSARRETERVLTQDRAAARGPALGALLACFQRIIEQGRDEVLFDPMAYPAWFMASSALRSTRAPRVETVLEWLDQMAWFFEFHGTNDLGFLNGGSLSAAEANPSAYVAERLGMWDNDPEGHGEVMDDELRELRSLHWFVQ